MIKVFEISYRNYFFIEMYNRSKKKRNTPIYFNTDYRAEMKLVPIIMYNCLLQLDVLNFFLGVHLHRGSVKY